MKITGKTRLLGIIGHPVEHSLSPLMQNEALQMLGLDYLYVPFPVSPEVLTEAVKGLKCLGVAGFNVTIPHKEAIIPLLDALSPEAELSGAVNTVKNEGGRLIGFNTDGTGLVASLKEDLGFEPAGKSVLVFGAGGAARGGIAALCAAGVSSVIIANRDLERAEGILEIFRNEYVGTNFAKTPYGMDALKEILPVVDLLLNTTSVGMNGTAFEWLDLAGFSGKAAVYDMVYTPFETPLLRLARELGLKCANGLGMLASQGEAGFRIWTGVEPPSNVMKTRLLTELGQ